MILTPLTDAEKLTKLKSDVERLRGPQEFILQRITTPMSFAVKVEITDDKDGRIFKFVDHTGHAHGYFQEGNPLSSVPENVAGVLKYDGWWFWMIRALEDTK